MSVRTRLVLDVGLFTALIVAYAPYATGISVHEWLSIAIVAPALLHLIVNWDWVIRVVANVTRRLSAASAVNLVIDALLFVSAVTVMVSGFAISRVVGSVLGLATTATQLWSQVHSVSADASVALLFIHFVLHARWMKTVIDGWLRLLDGETPRPAAATVQSSVDR